MRAKNAAIREVLQILGGGGLKQAEKMLKGS